MKDTLLIAICLCLMTTLSSAQIQSAPPTPINRDAALKIKTIQDVFAIADSIYGGTVSLVSRKGNVTESWKPAKGMNDPIIAEMISQAKSGERLVFSNFVRLAGGKEIKLDTKTYVFK